MAKLAVKDAVILGHIYLYACGMMVFMFRHPESAGIAMPAVGGLLGLTHWFVIHDDKVPDAP